VYHLQFSHQAASPETFGYSLVWPLVSHKRLDAKTDGLTD